ncbi:MAG: GAF domain-containing protein [Anaerolineae bacterium]|nr:GAF domain-containing protein [Anaerolineae bacterium]
MTAGDASGALPRNPIDALREIGRAINSAWGLDSSLDLITRRTAHLMGMDSCSIYLLSGDRLTLQASTGLDRAALGRGSLRVGEGLTGWAVAHGQAVASSDAASDPRFQYVPGTREERFQSLLALPLVNQDHIIGAINVQTQARHEFSQAEIDLLALIGDLAAGALEKAILTERLQRQVQELTAVQEVSQAVTSSLYLEEMLGLIVELTAKTMNVHSASLVLFDQPEGELVIHARPNLSAEYQRRPHRAPGEGIAGVVAETRRPVIVADVREDSRFRDPERARREGLCSLLGVPLVVRDRVRGVLRCYTQQPHAFSDTEVALLSTLANQTALAIENAHLSVRAAVVQEMHHRVKNNLQTVAMLLRLQMSDPKAAAARPALQESINRILSIAEVHEILAGASLGMVDVRALAERVSRAVSRNMLRPDQRVAISVGGDAPSLPSQPATSLALAVAELVQNSLEHGLDGRNAGHIHIDICDMPAAVTLVVTDDGRGLPPDFDAAVQANLGIQIIRTLIEEDLGGTFRYAAGASGGAAATLTIPRGG